MSKHRATESALPPQAGLYTPLSTAGNEIRIIILHRGVWTDEIDCRLLVHTLDKAASSVDGSHTGPVVPYDEDCVFRHTPHPLLPLPTEYAESGLAGPSSIPVAGYEALSYVWGDSALVRPISVNDQTLFITHNLFWALKHLRLPHSDRRLWIDAVCINQDDIEERTQQVQIMQLIYWRARRAVVWLGERVEESVLIPNPVRGDEYRKLLPEGEEPLAELNKEFGIYQRHFGFRNSSVPFEYDGCTILDDTGGAFDMLRILAAFGGHIDEAAWEGNSIFEHLEKGKGAAQKDPAAAKTVKDVLKAIWPALKEIMNRPWWNRVWIVQECVLPKQVVMACGAVTIDWVVFSQAARYFLSHSTCCLKLGNEKALFEKFRLLDRIRFNIQRGSRYPILEGCFDLPLLMGSFRHRSATDERDKVYSVLGLIDDDEWIRHPPPLVDYRISTAEAFAIAAFNNIKIDGDLRSLPGPREPQVRSGFPSWVVDWSLEGEDPTMSLLLQKLYEDVYYGSRNHKGHVSLYSDLVLGVQGHKIDTISTFCGVVPQSSENTYFGRPKIASDFRPWLISVIEALRTGPLGQLGQISAADMLAELDLTSYDHEDTYMSALCRTLSADMGYLYKRNTPKEVEYVRKWVYSEVRDHRQASYSACKFLFGHNFFITKEGCIGMAPLASRKGDVLYILEGGGTPIVLRPCEPPPPCLEDKLEHLANRHGTLSPTRRRLNQQYFTFVGHCYVHAMMDKGNSIFEDGNGEVVMLR